MFQRGRWRGISPYFYKCSGKKGKPTPKQLIEESPKLYYIMECIKSVKEYHEKTKTEVSGQVIYMDIGVSAFPMLRDYLVDEIGYEENEIGCLKNIADTLKVNDKMVYHHGVICHHILYSCFMMVDTEVGMKSVKPH